MPKILQTQAETEILLNVDTTVPHKQLLLLKQKWPSNLFEIAQEINNHYR